MDSKRRLSAVWFADIVGYTTLSRTDEPAALTLVDLLQRLAKTVIASHEGRVVKFIGDAVLAEFSSTDSAVRAAVALQEQYVAAASEAGQDSRLRIGVHLGEVAATADGDLYGDGINTAARLHQEATPGQVIISEDVWRQLRQRPEFRFSSLGAVELRGISTRVEIFDVLFGTRAALGGAPASVASGAPGAKTRRSTVLTIGAIAAGLAIVAAIGFFRLRPDEPAPAIASAPPASQPAPPEAPQDSTPPPASPPSSAAAQPKTDVSQPTARSRQTEAREQPQPKPPEPVRQEPPPAPPPAPAPQPVTQVDTPATVPVDGQRARPERSPETVREAAEIRALLERLAEAIGSDRPRERVAALGPGAVAMSGRGVQQMRQTFGDDVRARLGRIEHIATREDAVEIRFFLLVTSPSRQRTAPLAFTATISRGSGERRFLQLRRDFAEGGREGRGRGGLSVPE